MSTSCPICLSTLPAEHVAGCKVGEALSTTAGKGSGAHPNGCTCALCEPEKWAEDKVSEMLGKGWVPIHDLLFMHPTFHSGTNVTVRRGLKWAGTRSTTILRLTETSIGNVIGFGVVEECLVTKCTEIPPQMLELEHDRSCRTTGGLLTEMSRIYPGFEECEDVTVISFTYYGLCEDWVSSEEHQTLLEQLATTVEKLRTAEMWLERYSSAGVFSDD